MHAACFSTAHGWWLQLLVLAALFDLLARPRLAGPRRAGLIAGMFGLASFAAGLAWLYISMHRYGGLPAPLAALGVLLLAAYLALFGALALGLAEWLAPAARAGTGAWLRRSVALASCWALGEAARGCVLTGFPWLSLAYAQVDGPLAPIATTVGTLGLGAATTAAAAALAALVRGGRTAMPAGLANLAAVGLVLAGLLAFARVGSIAPAGPQVSVRLLQGNVGQSMKFEPQRALQALHDYVDDVVAGTAQLTVLPETAWTTLWEATPPALADAIFEHLGRTAGALAVGLPARAVAHPQMLSNSVLVFGPHASELGRYDKRQLVPFGEYIPPAFGWFVRMMNIPLGEFARGAAHQALIVVGGQRFAFDICYEDLFGGLLREQVRDGATVLVNVSNIAWFGDSHALQQHLNISRLRAIELGRPMLRATNTGMTAAIDPTGKVYGALPPLTRGALDVTVVGTRGMTPYARFGSAPTLIGGILGVFVLACRRRLRKS